MPKLQFGEGAYRIVGDNGEEGELVEYGVAATLDTGIRRYVAVVDTDPDDPDEVVSLLPDGEWLVDGRAVEVDQEDVEFAGPEGEGGGRGEGGDDNMEEETEIQVDDNEDEDEDLDDDTDSEEDVEDDDNEEEEEGEEDEDDNP